MDPDDSSPRNMRGRVNIGGNVSAGRDFVAGDVTYSGVQAQDLTNLFGAVHQQIAAHAAAHPNADPDLLTSKTREIERETAKGDQADQSIIRRNLNTLVQLAPDVAEILVNGLTNPGAAVASGIRMLARSFSSQTPPANDTSSTAV